MNMKKVIAFAGVLDISKKDLLKSKIEKAYCIVPQSQSLIEAIKKPPFLAVLRF